MSVKAGICKNTQEHTLVTADINMGEQQRASLLAVWRKNDVNARYAYSAENVPSERRPNDI
jgi:hypothetical protein